MKLMSAEYADRLRHWLRTLEEELYRPLAHIALSGFATSEYLTEDEAARRDFAPMQEGQAWGKSWEYLWLRGEIDLPEEAAGHVIAMDLNPGAEAALFVNGEAFGTRRTDRVHAPHHIIVDNILTERGVPGQRFTLLMEAYAGHFISGVWSRATGPVLPGSVRDEKCEGARARIGACTYGVWNEDTYQLYMDVNTLKLLLEQQCDTSLRAADLAQALEGFAHIVDFEQPADKRNETYRAARAFLKPYLSSRGGEREPTMYAVGNAHLDLAWLWPVAETCRKTARTFAQQLRLLDKYPSYLFMQSQPAEYEMCRAHYPKLYARIKEAARAGRWIADGAMYVEPDTNMASGEALIRQLVYGKRFYQEEFNVDSRLLWLPDTFGYTAALPQILKGCGVDYLVTQKIFWSYNDADRFPYHYFYWRGMDGSRVVSFLPTSYTYRTDPEAVCKAWNGRVQARDLDAFLMPFGYGDGGGGPCRDHIEYALREADLQGMPRVKIAGPMEFFQDMEAQGGPKNTWDGELYFSAHRGTYTTQAKIKNNNRRAEVLLRECELWGVIAHALGGRAVEREALGEMWRTLLRNQFHDILPGSSIARVYEEANAELEALRARGEGMLLDTFGALLPGKDAGITCFNSLAWRRRCLVPVDARFDSGACTTEGESVPVADGLALVTLPAMGWVSLVPAQNAPCKPVCEAKLTDNGFILQNDRVTARFDALGRMVSLCTAQGETLFAGGLMNELCLYKDVPRKYDAWDIDSVYENDPVALEEKATLTVTRACGLRAVVRVTRHVEDSLWSQEIALDAGEETITFDTAVDWHALHRLLKVRFDGGILAREAIHEIQFGYVERPTHRSGLYEQTRFEVCNHHYTALCDQGRGFAVLNDGKYGVSARDGAISLTLLRAAASPAFCTDQGEQHFTYAFTCWRGAFMDAPVARQGYALNQPVRVSDGARPAFSAFETDAPNVIVETVKPAEDQSGDIVLRVYECKKAQTHCRLTARLPFARAYRCDMLENPLEELPSQDGEIALTLRAFEIVTLRLKR